MKHKVPLVIAATVAAIAVVAALVYGFMLAGAGHGAPASPPPSPAPSASESNNPEVSSSPTAPATAPTSTQAPTRTPTSRHPLIDAAEAIDAQPFTRGEDAAFFTPGRKAYCQMDRSGVLCDLTYKVAFHSDADKHDCEAGELVNDGASLGAEGARFGVCRSDTPLRDLCPRVDPSSADAAACAEYAKTATLKAGQRITLGDYTCAADAAGAVECITEQHGFRVGPSGYATH